jgi:hypothetical protein
VTPVSDRAFRQDFSHPPYPAMTKVEQDQAMHDVAFIAN